MTQHHIMNIFIFSWQVGRLKCNVQYIVNKTFNVSFQYLIWIAYEENTTNKMLLPRSCNRKLRVSDKHTIHARLWLCFYDHNYKMCSYINAMNDLIHAYQSLIKIKLYLSLMQFIRILVKLHEYQFNFHITLYEIFYPKF